MSCLGNSSKLMFSDKILKVVGVLRIQLTIGAPAERPLDHGSVPPPHKNISLDFL